MVARFELGTSYGAPKGEERASRGLFPLSYPSNGSKFQISLFSNAEDRDEMKC